MQRVTTNSFENLIVTKRKILPFGGPTCPQTAPSRNFSRFVPRKLDQLLLRSRTKWNFLLGKPCSEKIDVFPAKPPRFHEFYCRFKQRRAAFHDCFAQKVTVIDMPFDRNAPFPLSSCICLCVTLKQCFPSWLKR